MSKRRRPEPPRVAALYCRVSTGDEGLIAEWMAVGVAIVAVGERRCRVCGRRRPIG